MSSKKRAAVKPLLFVSISYQLTKKPCALQIASREPLGSPKPSAILPFLFIHATRASLFYRSSSHRVQSLGFPPKKWPQVFHYTHTHTDTEHAARAICAQIPRGRVWEQKKKSWILLPFTANNCSRLSQRSPMILTFFYGPPPCEYICVWSLRGVRSRAVTWPWRGGAFPGLWMGLNLSSPLSLMRACVRCDRKR